MQKREDGLQVHWPLIRVLHPPCARRRELTGSRFGHSQLCSVTTIAFFPVHPSSPPPCPLSVCMVGRDSAGLQSHLWSGQRKHISISMKCPQRGATWPQSMPGDRGSAQALTKNGGANLRKAPDRWLTDFRRRVGPALSRPLNFLPGFLSLQRLRVAGCEGAAVPALGATLLNSCLLLFLGGVAEWHQSGVLYSTHSCPCLWAYSPWLLLSSLGLPQARLPRKHGKFTCLQCKSP